MGTQSFLGRVSRDRGGTPRRDETHRLLEFDQRVTVPTKLFDPKDWAFAPCRRSGNDHC
jgi:hypothetical protein